MPSALFIHENFPAQFGAIADALAERGWDVVFATQKAEVKADTVHRLASGVRLVRYERAREPRDDGHPYLRGTESAILNGQGFSRLGMGLFRGGFAPDVVIAHSGWGSGSFAKVVWPDAKFIQYLEWWYNFPAPDVDESTIPPRMRADRHARTLARNLPFYIDFEQADLVISPTHFQAAQAPDFVQSKLVVQHDGIDCAYYRNGDDDDPVYTHPDIPQDAPIVSFATRGMEPMRGFPTFMAAAEQIQDAHPDVHIVVAGNDKAHYGPEPKDHPTWKAKALADHAFDHARLHFTGPLPRNAYAKLLRRTQAHVYLTRPFVLSWSLLEAMASAAPVDASDVAPVREVATATQHAKLVPENAPESVVQAVTWCLNHRNAAREMGLRARDRVIDQYEIADAHDRLEALFRAQVGTVADTGSAAKSA